MNLLPAQILQLAVDCGFEVFSDCIVTENNDLKEVDIVYMGDQASLVQFAEQLWKLKEKT